IVCRFWESVVDIQPRLQAGPASSALRGIDDMTWSKEQLAALQQRYSDNGATETRNPRFRRVADKIFQGGKRKAPYSGRPTLLDAPALDADPSAAEFAALDVALLGIPMDLGVSNRPGARFGPRALRATERIGPYNHFLDCAPVFELNVADVGDAPLSSRYRLEQCHDDIERHVGAIVGAGVRPLSVGGDHSITCPILKAVAQQQGPVGLIHIDAHCDTGGPYD